MYPDATVARLIDENFVPVRVHVREQADEFKRLGERYGVVWTPAILILDGGGKERHRIEGFLPAEDLVPMLMLGLGHHAFAERAWSDAERRFNEIVARAPESAVASEALYWGGVARYKGTSDKSTLADTARSLSRHYPRSTWAKKASIWLPEQVTSPH